MFCNKCGYENSEGAKNCVNCGQPLAMPGGEPMMWTGGAGAVAADGPVLSAVKKLIKSPAFLISVISFTIYFALCIIDILSPQDRLMGMMMEILDELDVGVPYELYFYLDYYSDTLVTMSLIGMIPTALLLLGMWITLISACNKNRAGMSTAGLTIIKVLQIITLVFLYIGAIFATIATLLALVENARVGLIVLFIMAVVYVPMILYYSFLIGTINRMKYTIHTGNADAGVSMYVAAICFLAAIWNLIMIYFSGISGLFYAIAQMGFGVYLAVYKNKMKEIIWHGTGSRIVSAPASAEGVYFGGTTTATVCVPAEPTPLTERKLFCNKCGNPLNSYGACDRCAEGASVTDTAAGYTMSGATAPSAGYAAPPTSSASEPKSRLRINMRTTGATSSMDYTKEDSAFSQAGDLD